MQPLDVLIYLFPGINEFLSLETMEYFKLWCHLVFFGLHFYK